MLTAAFNLTCLLALRSASTPILAVAPSMLVAAPDPALAPTRAAIDATEIGTLSPAALDEIAAQATAEAAKHGIAPHELKISLVGGEVLRAVEELEQPAVEEPGPGEPETAPDEPEVPPDGETPPRGEPPPRWWLPTGAALTAVGGAGLVAGVAMVAAGERPIRAEGIRTVDARDWRNPTGYVVLSVGAGALAAGVTLLVLHYRACRKTPGSCGGKESASQRGRRDWAVTPWLGGGELGVGLTGRFSGRNG